MSKAEYGTRRRATMAVSLLDAAGGMTPEIAGARLTALRGELEELAAKPQANRHAQRMIAEIVGKIAKCRAILGPPEPCGYFHPLPRRNLDS